MKYKNNVILYKTDNWRKSWYTSKIMSDRDISKVEGVLGRSSSDISGYATASAIKVIANLEANKKVSIPPSVKQAPPKKQSQIKRGTQTKK